MNKKKLARRMAQGTKIPKGYSVYDTEAWRKRKNAILERVRKREEKYEKE